MKKLLFVAMMFTVSIAMSWAQGTSGGIKGGLNFANQTAASSGVSITATGLTSFHVGGYVTAMFTDKLGIQPELLYSVQGAKSGSITDSYSYLNIPVLFRVNVAPVVNFHVGPQLGLCLAAKSESGGTTTDFKDQVNTVDFALALGAGFDLGKFTGGLRYNMGLSNIAKNAPSGVTVKHNVFQIYIGLKLFGAGM